MAALGTGVVVWEWLGARWIPYEPHVSDCIEDMHNLVNSNGLNFGGTVLPSTQFSLDSVDSSLAGVVIDLSTMQQISKSARLSQPIRRVIYRSDSVAGQGIVWQWCESVIGQTPQWHRYDFEVAEILEQAHIAGIGRVDLTQFPCQQPYIVDLTNMSQIRRETGFIRSVQRIRSAWRYSKSVPISSGKSQQLTSTVSTFSSSAVNPLASSAGSSMASSVVNPLSSSAVNPLASSTINLLASSAVSPLASSAIRPMASSAVYQLASSAVNHLASSAVYQLASSAVNHLASSAVYHLASPAVNPLVSSSMNPAKNLNYAGSSGGMGMLIQPSVLNQPSQMSFMNPMMHQSNAVASLPYFPSNFSSLFAQPQNAQSVFHSAINPLQPFLSSLHSQPFVSCNPFQSAIGPSQSTGGVGQVQLNVNSVAGPSLSNVGQLSSAASGSSPDTRITVKAHRQLTRKAKSVTPAVILTGNPQDYSTLSLQLTKSGARNLSSISGSTKKLRVSEAQMSQMISNDGTYDARQELLKYIIAVDHPPKDEECCICCEPLCKLSSYAVDETAGPEVIKLSKCNHMLHKPCLIEMCKNDSQDVSHIQCPTCKRIYGTKLGNCPTGTMAISVQGFSLAGYEGYGTIKVMYNIQSGKQGPAHPHPGQRFTARGFPRVGYLPDNDEGRLVLKLLKLAWMRKLTFTIGTSVTTGEPDTVVWNEIHHKTEIMNQSGHGYPDPNYLKNILAELAAQGVQEEDL